MGLVLVAAVLALVGGVTLYLREEVVDSQAFADRAVEAVHQPTVQHVVARQITVQLIEPGFPDLVAGRPVISSAVRVAVTSAPFAHVIRLAALHGHRLLFQRNGGNAVFDIADAGKVVSTAHGANEVSSAEARSVVNELFGALLGDLLTWTLAIAAIAWVVAAASSTVLSPYSPADGLRRLWAGLPRPVSPRGRGAQGLL